MMRGALWRFLTTAETGLEATKIAGLSVAGMTVRERLFQLVRAFVPQPEHVTVFGNHRLYLPERHKWEPSYLNGVHEPGTTAVFRQLLQPGMGVVDVGAHVGYFSLLAAVLVGEAGRVYAFEPEPDNYALLVKNVEVNGYKNVTCLQRAVSQDTGSAQLFLRKYSLEHSLSPPEAGNARAEGMAVKTTSLDEYFAGCGWPSIHLVKMDIEGWEWPALEGMTELLRRSERLKLVLEFTPSLIRQAGKEPSAFLDRMQKLGLRVSVIDDVNGLVPLRMSTLQRQRGSNLLCERV
jgi:FkbM family methyltransferase